ncbi:MAG: ATP-binding protein, partial [Moraxellaceae bacterium]
RTADVQVLREQTVSLLRASRQYAVLDDRALLRRAEQAEQALRQSLRRLGPVVPAALQADWQRTLAQVAAALALRAPAAREQALRPAGAALETLTQATEAAVQAALRADSEAQLVALEDGREQVLQRFVAALVLTLLLVAVLGWWLVRPLRRLEHAIRALGESRFDTPVDLPGPADLQRLGQQLDWLRLRLAELDADKARFLRHVSHELKTPLASLREGVALLDDEVAGALTPAQREVVDILQEHTRRLQQQIEELLRFNAAAFEARQLQRSVLSLRSVLAAVIEAQRLHWQARNLSVTLDGADVSVEGDAEKLAAAFGNLLANALRFSPVGDRVGITISRLPDGVAVDIVDAGPGVAPEDRERLFEPFYRGRRQPEDGLRGSGIGLSIVQEYAVAHGGRVSLLPSAAGAHFRFELPHVRTL